jgi:hypothetical protein
VRAQRWRSWRLATAFHPNQFRLETAADRELGGAGTKNAALEGRARHECRSSPDSQLTMERFI